MTKLHTNIGGLMSSSMVTIEVSRDENETVFLLHVVQAALQVYRNPRRTSGHAHDAHGLIRDGLTHGDHQETISSSTSA